VLYVTTALKVSGTSPAEIETFRIHSATPAEARGAAFSLEGKSRAQTAFVVATIASVAFMGMMFLGVVLTKMGKRKWFWAPLSLVGGPIFAMNWATGAWELRVAVGLINAGVSRGSLPWDPWLVTWQVPFGALIVMMVWLPVWWDNTRKTRAQS